MSYSITDWNINPNITWFVRIHDIGSEMQIDLYDTQADAEAETNSIATGTVSFGTNVSVVLTENSVFGLTYFNEELSYHLKVSGTDGDAYQIFKILPFTDLPDVNNSIYRSESLIQRKAIYEINKHVHVINSMSLGLAGIVSDLSIGDICRIYSANRNIDVLAVAEDINITGTLKSLTTSLESSYFTDIIHE